ncbi:keratin, type I cytoskeletal 18-like [Pteronotus mesoamericanus]|uniref:keratin, type I cytoskeletal 18-like n=1 Tax=Pteronotus mesoamericanus TaxID=1884717 RepID=UPI0023EC0C64|nr:keratin, type I cytoskeletal 18-like [Pteronotus parnellii mesoamericanus]
MPISHRQNPAISRPRKRVQKRRSNPICPAARGCWLACSLASGSHPGTHACGAGTDIITELGPRAATEIWGRGLKQKAATGGSCRSMGQAPEAAPAPEPASTPAGTRTSVTSSFPFNPELEGFFLQQSCSPVCTNSGKASPAAPLSMMESVLTHLTTRVAQAMLLWLPSEKCSLKPQYPKSQDLGKIMVELWAQHKDVARKNREELDKSWSHRTEESTTVVTTQTAEIGAAETTLTELRHTVQSLETDLDSMRNLKVSLENSLREVEIRCAMQMAQLNGTLLHLEAELTQIRAEGQHQAQEYEALLNINVKLEAKIATYRHLLEKGEDFSLFDALDKSHSLETIQKTTTHKIVDVKVVSEVNNTKVLRH